MLISRAFAISVEYALKSCFVAIVDQAADVESACRRAQTQAAAESRAGLVLARAVPPSSVLLALLLSNNASNLHAARLKIARSTCAVSKC